MATQIYVNLPVKNLKNTVDFFTKLGFSFDPMFTDEKATCMIIDENIYVMLLVEEFFKTFIRKDVANTAKATEVILAISAESREKVDELINKALAAGGTTPTPKQDHGYMYSHGFQDPDGHLWEVMYMDVNAFPQG